MKMLIYKIEAQIQTESANQEPNTQEYAYSLHDQFEKNYQKYDKKLSITICSIKENKCTIALQITDDLIIKHTIKKLCQEFLQSIGINLINLKQTEITINSYQSLISIAEKNHFIKEEDEYFEKLGFDRLIGRFNKYDYKETILFDNLTKKNIKEEAKNLLCEDTLIPEIERIYAPQKMKTNFGHPVHYLIQTDDPDIKNIILKLLLIALNKNDRIKSKRYSEVNYGPLSNIPGEGLNALYKASFGGTVVINYYNEENEENEFANSGLGVIGELCSIMKNYKKNVLTILCLPRSSEQIKNLFYEQLDKVSIIELNQEVVYASRARQYLTQMAKNNNIKSDKELLDKIANSNRGYLTTELNKYFDDWFDKYLKTNVYTQYSGVISSYKKEANIKAKGSAYQTLTEMIGLTEAKAVINKALDYYKAQKLFASKGMPLSKNSMHMVFTGNPGTAKTTVARLFAQICKDNGLLSVGDLFEVGRADLVGKYVGWTAQTVRKKFKMAKGSILFIDEAYSLVDNKDGMFGDEAINTIVAEMENMREDIIVIFAGYPDKMEAFLQKNPGLRSRIAFHIPFADYMVEELLDILELMAKNKNLVLDDKIKDKLMPLIYNARAEKDFGNGRFVRNLLEKARMNQASRLLSCDIDSISEEDICTITSEDFEMPSQKQLSTKSRIGF